VTTQEKLVHRVSGLSADDMRLELKLGFAHGRMRRNEITVDSIGIPTLMMGSLKIPVVIQASNEVHGIASRYVARLEDKVCAFKGV
jgi:hypothetical protein